LRKNKNVVPKVLLSVQLLNNFTVPNNFNVFKIKTIKFSNRNFFRKNLKRIIYLIWAEANFLCICYFDNSIFQKFLIRTFFQLIIFLLQNYNFNIFFQWKKNVSYGINSYFVDFYWLRVYQITIIWRHE